MSTLPTETRATPVLPFGMTAEELLDAVCPSPRRKLDEQGEAETRPGLTLRQRHALRVYPLLLDAFLGEPVRLSMHEADALLSLVDAELASDATANATDVRQAPVAPRKRSRTVWVGGAR